MIALLKDQQVLHRPFAGMTTGYRAQTIILEKRDVAAMIELLHGPIESRRQLSAHLCQLEMRWEE